MPIQITAEGWVLETRTTAYALGITASGALVHRYWGPRLPYPEDYPPPLDPAGWASFDPAGHMALEEYPGYGGTRYHEPCLKATFADGVRDVAPRFDGAAVDEDAALLTIHLRDAYYPLHLALHYRLHEDHDLIERWVTVANEGRTPVMLERVLSAQWHLPSGASYRMSHLTGRWSDEMHLRRDSLPHGVTRLESRRLTTSHQHLPWFALDRGDAAEDGGQVWFGSLAWSGNWLLLAEVTPFAATRVSLGYNDWDFAWRLGPTETLDAPPCFGGYTASGFGAMSRLLHDFTRDRLLPHGDAPHPVLYNSWEATEFDVDEQSQITLATQAAALGVELFVVDDGWFHGRHTAMAGLGDWWPDERKFPRGLRPLIDHVKALGMGFGLWIEPEMVNPNSDLYRTHPDWVIHFPTRTRTEERHQLILNLARADVRQYLIEALDALLTANSIDFIKWDMNRNVSEPGWPDAPGEPRELWVRYVWGLYEVWQTLRDRHPRVTWQSCSGGGGRADLAILRLADQIWTSDNTDAMARLAIQEGFSQLFPAATMEAWATDVGHGRIPLAFRFHVAMCGALGVGGHLPRWSEEERAEAARWIALYKQIRPLVQHGDLYRLRSPREHAFSALLYVARDRVAAVLFAFRTHLPFPALLPPLYLRGLDPNARYTIEGSADARSGAAWQHDGLRLTLGDFESTVRRIQRVAD